ncbi:MAG: aromatic ring-hydroxylating dioxygenase subunit alpha, partial [Candidatus Eremiobacteraeota bacterium]|nr:aromatic ring-hydroxylating dioxygenase subunit alpha [Candidatus Eremiobacteraeota bacterium]
MPRSAPQWESKPHLPATHYVDPALYTNEQLFQEEKEKIFARSWIIACHESEILEKYDYRTFSHPADRNLFVVRGDDGAIRSFYNVCPHRGNTILYTPAGNAKHLVCIFHAFAFDSKGNCVDIPREKAGYQDRLCKADFGLREVRTTVGYGGFVFVNLSDDAPSLDEFIGHALDGMLPSIEAEPLEVFSFHRATVDTNYKLWHDTNSEFYHDYMHYHNRQTSMLQSGYFDR